MEGRVQDLPRHQGDEEGHDKKKLQGDLCHGIREDGAFIEAGENDVLIVQKLVANPNALRDLRLQLPGLPTPTAIQGTVVNGVAPEFETISSRQVPGLALDVLLRQAGPCGRHPRHQGVCLASSPAERAWGPDGYLVDKGLIPLSDADRKKIRAIGDERRQAVHVAVIIPCAGR